MIFGGKTGKWGAGARGGDGVVEAVVGHVDTKVLDN